MKEKKPQWAPQPPLLEFCTIARSDATWSASTRNAGFGWIVVNREQRTLRKIGASLIPSALIVEGLTLKEAVGTWRQRGVKEVRFESDSSLLVRAINNVSPCLELYGIVEDIHILSNAFDCVASVWIPRERNCEADMLAKNTLMSFEQGMIVALVPPPE